MARNKEPYLTFSAVTIELHMVHAEPRYFGYTEGCYVSYRSTS